MRDFPTKAIFILPFAFLLHNAEELYALANGWSPIDVPYSVSSFAVAVLLFSILGFILVFRERLYKRVKQYCYTMTGFAGMLFLNAFIPHITLSIAILSYTPGLITAVVLLLPLSVVVLRNIRESATITGKGFIRAILMGGITGALLIPIFLGFGYLVTDILDLHQRFTVIHPF
jgi:hypothetical protein